MQAATRLDSRSNPPDPGPRLCFRHDLPRAYEPLLLWLKVSKLLDATPDFREISLWLHAWYFPPIEIEDYVRVQKSDSHLIWRLIDIISADYKICPQGADIYIPQEREICKRCAYNKWLEEKGQWEAEAERVATIMKDPSTWTPKLSDVIARTKYTEMMGIYDMLRHFNPGWIDLDIDVDVPNSDLEGGMESGYESEEESETNDKPQNVGGKRRIEVKGKARS